jgi:hypothetical protein
MYRSHAGVMDPVSLLAGCQQKLVFSPLPHYVVREKLGMDPQIRQPLSCGLCREPFFLGAVDLYKFVDYFAKDCYEMTV